MKIAHFSDTHLGFTQFSAHNEAGLNQRESDVFGTFCDVLDSILEHEPDIILHTGDFFHRLRPSNHTLIATFRKLMAVQRERVAGAFIIVAGNHESPRSAGSGCILDLFDGEKGAGIPGVQVVVSGTRKLNCGEVEIACVPSSSFGTNINVEPVAGKVSVLAAHGLDAQLSLGSKFSISELARSSEWAYIALGDYHVHKELMANAAYCGSTDFTSTNIWEEAAVPKGWILFDSETGVHTFREVSPRRRVLDLDPFDATDLSSAEIADRLHSAAQWPRDEKPIVRQRIFNVAPDARMGLDSDVVRDISLRALYYYVDWKYAKKDVDGMPVPGAAGASLEDDWRNFASVRNIPSAIGRDEFTETGTSAIKEAAGVSAED
jgi:DNA repair exonuclease SbcCD nuclease subunit